MGARGISDGIWRDAWKTQHATGPADALMDYRYTLTRIWNTQLPIVLWILANPSTADDKDDDQTCKKAMGFSRRWGFGGMVFANLSALCATKPAEWKVMLAMGYDPIGPFNDQVISYLAYHIRFVVCAWGDCLGPWAENVRRPQVMSMLRATRGVELKCLGRTARFNPQHPLVLGYNTPLESYA